MNQNSYLPDSTPLFFEWITREPETLEPDQHPIPNTPKLPYHERLKQWAKHEPQRKIKLYYTSSNLTDRQKQKMKELKIKTNIEVIDFDKKFKDKFNLQFLENEKVPFSWKIDLMRIIMLLEDGPGMYLDFDTLPKNNDKIGSIKMNKEGILLGGGVPTGIHNAIIAVDSPNNQVLRYTYDAVMKVIEDPDQSRFEHLAAMKGSLVYYLQKFTMLYIFNPMRSLDQLPTLFEKRIESCLTKDTYTEVFFRKKENEPLLEKLTVQGSGANLTVTEDNTWKVPPQSLYESGEQVSKGNVVTSLQDTKRPENLTEKEGLDKT